MAIFDVIVNTDDLVVLGPPEVIDVSVAIGQQGNRGATFFVGSGNPNTSSVYENVFGNVVAPVEGDIFINTATGSQYGWLYIYNPKVVGDQWDQILRLQPPYSAFSINASFSSGVATISIPLSQILPPSAVQNDPDKYIVSITPVSSDPISLSITSKSIVSSNLEISLNAIRYQSSAWSQLNSATELCVSVTVI